jgi:hypothetical protein
MTLRRFVQMNRGRALIAVGVVFLVSTIGYALLGGLGKPTGNVERRWVISPGPGSAIPLEPSVGRALRLLGFVHEQDFKFSSERPCQFWAWLLRQAGAWGASCAYISDLELQYEKGLR